MAVRHAPDRELIVDAAGFCSPPQKKTELHVCFGCKNVMRVTINRVTCECFLCDLTSQRIFSFIYFVPTFI